MHSRHVHSRPAASFDDAAGRLSDGAALTWLALLGLVLATLVWMLFLFLTG